MDVASASFISTINYALMAVLAGCSLGVLLFGYLGRPVVRGPDPESYAALVNWLATVSDRGKLFTRVTISSRALYSPSFAQFVHELSEGSLQPLATYSELQLRLWRGSTQLVISQNGTSICVIRLGYEAQMDLDEWSRHITRSLQATARQ